MGIKLLVVAAIWPGTEATVVMDNSVTGSGPSLPTPIDCPPGYMFCFDNDHCINIHDGTCLPKCETHERLEPTSDGHYECVDDTITGDDDDQCDGDDCQRCHHGQVFCFETGRCIDTYMYEDSADGVGICLPQECAEGEAMCYIGDTSYCDPTGVCDYGGGMDDDEECIGDECTLCYAGQVFCMETGRCVDTYEHHADGVGICLPKECGMGEELCYRDDMSYYCDPRGFCDDEGGKDDEGECTGDQCTVCPAGQIFCFESDQCIDRHGEESSQEQCKCDDTKEPCWSTGQEICVPVETCPVNRVRLVLGAAIAKDHSADLRDHIATQFMTKFQASLTAIPIAEFDDDLVHLDLLSSLSLELMRHKVEWMVKNEYLKDLSDKPLEVTAFVVEPCKDSNCAFGEMEEACSTDNQVWCKAVGLCLDKTSVCPGPRTPGVFYLRMAIGAKGVFERCPLNEKVRPNYILARIDGWLKEILAKLLSDLVTVQRLVVLPGGADTDGLIMIAQLVNDDGDVTESELMNRLTDLELTGDIVQHYSLVQEGEPTLVKVQDDAERTFLHPQPLTAGVDLEIDMSYVPADLLHMPVIVDCSVSEQKIQLSGPVGSYGFERKLESLSEKFVAKYTGSSFDHAKCVLISTVSSVQTSVRFLLVPHTLEEMTRVQAVSLSDAGHTLQLQEDDKCHHLPDDMFTFTFTDTSEEFLRVLGEWPMEMTELGEHWVGAADTVQRLAVGLRSKLLANVATLKVTAKLQSAATGAHIPSVSLYYKDKFVQERELARYKLDILSCQSLTKLCPKRNLNTDSTLTLTPHLPATVTRPDPSMTALTINIKVAPVNDPPMKRRRRSTSVSYLTFPRVPVEDDPAYTDPEFDVCESAAELFYDIDLAEGQELGLAAMFVNGPKTVAGEWLWSYGDGATWSPIPEFTYPYQAVFLECSNEMKYKIKFQPDVSMQSYSWTREEGPQLRLAGWDMDNKADLNGHNIIDVQIDCQSDRVASTNVYWSQHTEKSCLKGAGSSVSPLVNVTLERLGCDNKPMLGQTMMACGCDRPAEFCTDCNGEVNGEATEDSCGRCVGGTTGLAPCTSDVCLPDCSVTDCYKRNAKYCLSEEIRKKKAAVTCAKEGGVINPLYGKDSCTKKCIPDEQIDDDCYTCGENMCEDCAGEVGGNKVENLCKMCVAPENFDTDCSIGDFEPKYVYNAAIVNITARVPASLDSNADLKCQLSAMDNSPDLVTPVVVGNPIFMNSGEHHTITLKTSVPSADLSKALGQFSITCTLDGSDLPGSTQPVTRFGHPVLYTIAPAEALHSSLGEVTVTITGTGFVDTGVVRLIVECDEGSRDVWACRYGIPGEFVSDTKVLFKMAHLRKLKAGRVYKVNVVLGWKKHVDLTSLPAPLEFTVRAPAPWPEHALLDPNGCNKLRIRFNGAISGTDSQDCSNYFTNSQLAGGECWVNGRYLVASYSTKIASGTVLTFKEGVIQYAESEIADMLSGTVVAEMPEPKHAPQVKLAGTPSTVGCRPVRFAIVKRNTHCFNVGVSWTVDVINNDLSDQSLQDNLVELNDYLADKHDFFYMKANQLLGDWKYIITMTWSIDNDLHGGSVSRFLKKDESAIATAHIFGPSSDVDPAKQTKVQAKIQGCMSSLTEKPMVRWAVTGPIVINDLSQKTTTWIPANKLLYSSDYNITLDVTINGEEVSKTMAFRTKEGELEAVISYAGDASSNAVEVMDDEEIVLECSNKAVTSAAATIRGSRISETKCFWFCEDNFYSDSSDDFLPCYDNDGAYVTRTGDILSLPSADRKKPMDWDYRQKWTLIMNSGTQESNASRIITYKSIEQALAQLFGMNVAVPEITLLSPDFITVSDTDRRTIIHALCLSGTKFVWEGNTDDEEIGPLTWKSNKKPYLGKQTPLSRDVDRFSSCSTRLPLAWLALTPGEIYSLKLTLTNQFTTSFGDFSLAATKTVYIQMIPIPKPGIIEIYPDEGPYVAMETKIDVMLSGWDDDLSCYVYFFDDTRRKKVNMMSDAPDIPTMGLTMPEGVFKFEAICCNSYGACAEHQTDFTVTVSSVSANEIANIVSKFIMNLQLNLDLLFMVGDILDTLTMATTPVSEKDTMKSQVKSVANKEITSMFETSMENNDPKDKAAALGNSKEIVKGIEGGQSLEEDTRYSMRAAARDVVTHATGRRSWEERRKRSTGTGTGYGLTTEAAVDVLDVYTLSLIDETSLTQGEAVEFFEILDEVMVGMCIKQANTGTVAAADGTHVDVRLHRTATNGTADIEFDVGCEDCATFPAKVVYGSDIEDAYDSSWNSSAYTLEDICVASAQMSIDLFTPSVSVDTPARVSSIVLLRMLHPITYTTRSHDSLIDPVQVQLMIENSTTVNVTTYDYKCKMWESPVWSDSKCKSSEPQLVADDYRVVCSCKALGVISVFEQLKAEEEDTTTSTTQDSTAVINQQQQPTTTPVPSKPVAAWAQWLKIQFSFVESFDTITDITIFLGHVRNQLIALTRYTADNIKNLKVTKGSIVVTFELHSTGAATLGQMAYVVESVINSGSTSFTAPGGGALTIIPGSFSYTDQKVHGKDDNHTKDLLPYIIGGSLGGLAIIGMVIIVVVLIMKSNSSKTAPVTQPAQPTAPRPDSHPPEYIPNYALAPPPPYMYQPSPLEVAFPKTNKWVENELTIVKAGDVEKHERALEGGVQTNSRNNSDMSIETNMKRKEREKAPTPVA